MLEFIRNWGIPILMATAIISFYCFSKRGKYRDLRESGQRINLNLLNLLIGFIRPRRDPLRKSHVRLSIIGLLHLVAFVVGIIFLATIVSD